MFRVKLPGTDLSVSRFAFGTASLHHLGRTPLQASHLEAAAIAGFTHFDTAPLYGFGAAESTLGVAFGNEPRITIATKVGIYPPGGGDMGHLPMLARKIGGRLWPKMSRAVADFSVTRARQSIEDSLRRLRRDHVDLLLLHEPVPDLLHTDEWLRWRESEADRIRHMGIAGPAQIIAPYLDQDDSLVSVIQVRDGLVTREADVVTNSGRQLQLTYGYFSSQCAGRSSAEILSAALARNRSGAIVVSSRSRARLKVFAAAAEQQTLC